MLKNLCALNWLPATETCLWLLTSLMKNDLILQLVELAEASAPVHAVVEYKYNLCSNHSAPGALTNIAQVVLSISMPWARAFETTQWQTAPNNATLHSSCHALAKIPFVKSNYISFSVPRGYGWGQTCSLFCPHYISDGCWPSPKTEAWEAVYCYFLKICIQFHKTSGFMWKCWYS